MREPVEAHYRVTFERIGRTHDVAPLDATVTAPDEDHATRLAEAVYRYARRFLVSSEVDVHVDLNDNTVMIFCGFHTGGKGTVEVVDTVTA